MSAELFLRDNLGKKKTVSYFFDLDNHTTRIDDSVDILASAESSKIQYQTMSCMISDRGG